ncbi:MAG: antibiotic biosynthesis monooxygenase [Alphaproteobacteria bacterium]|nr:antibiotic biosynthesis monooxygenase [Alphaproteobacteria bacterium]
MSTVSIVTQTCVRAESAEAFARWQGETSTAISTFPGFLDQQLIPPNPPLQADWVILQRFATLEDAQRWLASPERHKRLEGAAPMLVGRDDVHVVKDAAGGVKQAPISAVMSTRVRPGKEAEYRAWERKIAVAQTQAPGLQGYRFEPPVPGVQDDYVAILRFDSEANLQAWLDSPERKKLVDEAIPLTEDFHARIARTGFEQWFRDGSGASLNAPAWKMNMLVLLTLYPVVFLWSVYVALPYLSKMSFAHALFVGNIVSVTITGFLVPWAAGRLGWWLKVSPAKDRLRVNLLGTILILALYAVMVFVFWRFFEPVKG